MRISKKDQSFSAPVFEYVVLELGLLLSSWTLLGAKYFAVISGLGTCMLTFFYIGEKKLKNTETKDKPLCFRSGASSGLWCSGILSAALLVSLPYAETDIYKLSCVASCILIGNSLVVASVATKAHAYFTGFLLLFIGTFICSKAFGLYGVSPVLFIFGCQIVFHSSFKLLVMNAASSFSVGECILVSQGLACFTMAALFNIYAHVFGSSILGTNGEKILIFVQVCHIGLEVAVAINTLDSIHILPFSIVVTVGGMGAFFVLPMLAYLLDENPFVWIFGYMVETPNRAYMFAWFIVATGVSLLATTWLTMSEKYSVVVIRKFFHCAIVGVFIPPILIDKEMITVASGVILGVFVFVEAIRVLRVPFLYSYIDEAIDSLLDSKDAGPLVLTPIYLLVGTSLPLWIYPGNLQEVTGAQNLALLSGVLSLGIGDTVAAVYGIYFGKTKWPGTNKTCEGTMASWVAQIATCVLLRLTGIIPQMCGVSVVLATLVVSLLEAFTLQIDNLVLPLVLYSMLMSL